MRFDYNGLLRSQLYALQAQLGISDYAFEIDSEQAFLKRKDMAPNTIYVLVRELQNDNGIGVDTQPVQLLVLAEQNGLDVAKAFFSEFAKKYNFQAHTETYTEGVTTHSIWIKQQYSDPVVLSNFNTVSYGYRSVLYISANLYIMYDVADLKELKIDSASVDALTFDFAYSMSPNTQQKGVGTNEFISRSTKGVSTMSISMAIPVVESELVTKALSIMNETDVALSGDKYGGNEDFVFDFWIGTTHFESKAFKLTAADFGAAINNVPAIRLGFIR